MGLARLSPRLGAIGRAVVRQHAATGDSPDIEPRHSPQQEAYGGVLLLVGQHLHVNQTRGDIDGDMGFLVARSRGATLTLISDDAMTDPLKAGQLLDVDMDHVAGPGPLVSPHGPSGLQTLEPSQPHDPEVARPKVESGATRSALTQRSVQRSWRNAEVVVDGASAAGGGEHCVDPPVRLARLCATWRATRTQCAG